MRERTNRLRARHVWRWEPGSLLQTGLIACALLALALVGIARMAAPNSASASMLIGRPAPTFTLPAAQGGKTNPSPITFAGASDHPTLLVFFNTLCVHCLSEISAARQAATTASDAPVDVIFIDTPGENAQITGAYMARLQLNPPILLDKSGAVARAYRVGYEPTLILVNTKGVICGVWVGETSSQTLASGIRQTLGR